jgi:hypothetical protein
MYTSLLLLALSSVTPAADSAPAWQTDYAAAREIGAAKQKPLVVVLGAGAQGWKKLDRDGSLSAEAKQILAEKYICVHIDTATAKGKTLADQFEMEDGLGIVISDRSGKLQAFRHEGDLADNSLVNYLNRYGAPDYVVLATESNPGKGSHGGSYYGSGSCGSCGSYGSCGSCGSYGSCGSCGSCSSGCGHSGHCGRSHGGHSSHCGRSGHCGGRCR